MDFGKTFPPIRSKTDRPVIAKESAKGVKEAKIKEPRQIAWCVSGEFSEQIEQEETEDVIDANQSRPIQDRWAKTRPRSAAKRLPGISPIRSRSAAEASFEDNVSCSSNVSTVRAGVFGVRHKALPGVVHFDLSWNLDSVADKTFDSLNNGTHPNKALSSVITRKKIQEIERKKEKRLERKRAANSRNNGPSKSSRKNNDQQVDELNAPFEIFVVRSFEMSTSLPDKQRRAEVRELESVLKGTIASSSNKQRRSVLRSLLFVISCHAMRLAFVRWMRANQLFTDMLHFAAVVTVCTHFCPFFNHLFTLRSHTFLPPF